MIHTKHRDCMPEEWERITGADIDTLTQEILDGGKANGLTAGCYGGATVATPLDVVRQVRAFRLSDGRVRIEVGVDYDEDEAHERHLAQLDADAASRRGEQP
jgi:hypothetical protein